MDTNELNFDEFVQRKIRTFEQYFGTVAVDGEINQFEEFTVTVHGQKETLTYTCEDMESYYMTYLSENAGPNALRPVY